MKRSTIIIACLLSLVLAQLPVGARPRTSEPFGLAGHDLLEAARAWQKWGHDHVGGDITARLPATFDIEAKMTLPGPRAGRPHHTLQIRPISALRANRLSFSKLTHSLRPDWSRFSILKPLMSEATLTTTEPVLATLEPQKTRKAESYNPTEDILLGRVRPPDALPQRSSCTFYVAPTGSVSSGDGGFGNPWNLLTVWNGAGNGIGTPPPASIHPGDTICLRGGTYNSGYYANLTGTPGHQITVMAYPGERVTIDGGGVAFNYGGYTTVRDIEMTNTATFRTDYRAGGFAVNVPGIWLIDNVIHDGGTGITSNDSGFDDLFYGNLIYNVGWDDRLTGLKQGGTGPGTYFQNATGSKRFLNNIVTNAFGLGISAYTAGNQAHLTGFEIQDNISYMNGYWTRYHTSAYGTEGSCQWNFLVGSSQTPLKNLIVSNNFGFQREQRYCDNYSIGYGTSQNVSATFSGNVSLGGNFGLSRFQTLNMSGNTIAWNQPFFYYNSAASPVSEGINNNAYYYYPGPPGAPDCSSSPNFISRDGGSTISVAAWKALGYDAASTFAPCGTRPPTSVTIKPNAYDANRFHVVVVNPSSATNVTLDLHTALSNGDTFQLQNAQNYYGPPVASGTYNGPITINMTTLTVAIPVGYSGLTNVTPLSLMTSGPQFGAFILIRK